MAEFKMSKVWLVKMLSETKEFFLPFNLFYVHSVRFNSFLPIYIYIYQ